MANEQIENMANYIASKTDTELEELVTRLKIREFDVNDGIFKILYSDRCITFCDINSLYSVIFQIIKYAYDEIYSVIDEIYDAQSINDIISETTSKIDIRVNLLEIRKGLSHYYENNVRKTLDSIYADVKNMKYQWIDEGYLDLIESANEQIENMANYVGSKTGVDLYCWSSSLKIKTEIVDIEMAIDLQSKYLYIFVCNMVENAYKNLYLLIEEL